MEPRNYPRLGKVWDDWPGLQGIERLSSLPEGKLWVLWSEPKDDLDAHGLCTGMNLKIVEGDSRGEPFILGIRRIWKGEPVLARKLGVFGKARRDGIDAVFEWEEDHFFENRDAHLVASIGRVPKALLLPAHCQLLLRSEAVAIFGSLKRADAGQWLDLCSGELVKFERESSEVHVDSANALRLFPAGRARAIVCYGFKDFGGQCAIGFGDWNR